MRNNNQAAVRGLSRRSFQNNRMRNGIAILAIILTGMLFTAVFSMVSGMMQTAEEQTMREVGGRAHAGLKDMKREQYEKIIADPMVKDSSYSILIGYAENLTKRQTEIRSLSKAEDLNDWFIKLSEGRFPQAEDEIIVDTFTMDECKVKHAVGERISLKFSFMGESFQKEFVISGWYEGDSVAHASEVIISEAYWEELKGARTEEEFAEWFQEHPEAGGAGLIQGNLFFDNASHIEEKVRKVISNAGYEPGTEIAYGVNWAYMQSRISSVDPLTLGIIAGAVLVITFTGYLIIFNIFQISVMSDIRFYGLLKTIGTTKKQIKRMIRNQAFRMSVIGIPIGLLAGFGIGKWMLPFALKIGNDGNTKVSLKFHPLIFVLGGLFSAFTVYLSCRRPGKIAGSVSPVEAVKYTEVSGGRRKGKKKIGRFGLLSMAFSNLGRNKQKTGVVVAAITLSMVLLTLVMTGVRSFRIEKYMDDRMVGDFVVGSRNYTGASAGVIDFKIEDAYIRTADAQKGILEKNEMWMNRYGRTLWMDEKALEQYQSLDAQGKLRRDKTTEYLLDQTLAGDRNLASGFYGYSDGLLEKLNVLEGTLDIEKFQKGDYILLGLMSGAEELGAEDSLYHPGDRVTIQSVTEESEAHEVKNDAGETIEVWYDHMESKEYEVMAIVDIPYSMNIHIYGANTMDAVLPLREFTENRECNECFAISYYVEEIQRDTFEEALMDYTENKNQQMGYLSRNSLQKEFSGMISMISTIGITLAGVVTFIGILNFINAVITGIIARKREFAMLQSIGMTSRQLQKMLVYEGIIYVVMAGFLSLIFGSLMAWRLLTALNEVIKFFEYRFQILPFVIMLPVLFLAAVAGPLLAYRRLKQKSIVERLRESD